MAETVQKQRVRLTELLQNTIKSLRKQYNKRGDVLSKSLGKGASYISQLENGKIKEIDFDSLMEIFRSIYSMNEPDFIKTFSDYIDSLLEKYTKEQILYEYWIHIFVVQEYPYPITDWVTDFIQHKLHDLNKTSNDLLKMINSNDYLDDIFFDRHHIPNKAYVSANSPCTYDNTEKYGLYIRTYYKLNDNFVDDILNRKITSISYVNIWIVFRQLFAMESSHVPYILEQVSKIMNDNGFYDSFERCDLLHKEVAAPISEITSTNPNDFIFYDNLITDYKEKYAKLKSKVFEKLEYSFEQYYKTDSAYSCEVMEQILKNFETDPGFTLAILSSLLSEIPNTMRSDFVEEFRSLLKRYANYKE